MTYSPSNPVTLPKLGNINLTLAKTPFQFPNGYASFFFLDGTGGFFGLTGAYVNQSIWGGAGQSNGNGVAIIPRSWWGFTLNETGIFNYSLGPNIPSDCVYPAENGSPFFYLDYPCTLQGPGGVLGFVQPSTSPFNPGFRFIIHGVLPVSFENISSPACPSTPYSADGSERPDGYEIWPQNEVYIQCVPYLMMEKVEGAFFPVPKIIGGSGIGIGIDGYPIALRMDPVNGPQPITMQPWDGPPATGFYALGDYGSHTPGTLAGECKVDPFNGNCLLFSYATPQGFYIGNVFAPFVYDDPQLYYGNPMPLNGLMLSDPNDQNYLANYSVRTIQQIPGGGFLFFPQGTNSSGDGTGFLVKRDLSGYYSVQIQGAPALWAPQGISGGSFGVSALGNLFIIDGFGNLYSSMGSAKIFDVLGFPDLQVTAVGCRRFDGCQLSFAG